MALVRMFCALNGDAFLIRENSAKDAPTILIDGGFGSTFHEQIRPELTAINAAGGVLNLLVVTHIDEDHIVGILALIEANRTAAAPQLIPIKNVWHNSLRSMMPARGDTTLTPTDNQILAAVRAIGYPSSNVDSSDIHDISARQGSSLATLLHKYGYTWNNSNGFTSISSASPAPYAISENMSIRVLGPTIQRLEELRSKWMESLHRLGFIGKIGSEEAFDDAFEFLCADATEDEPTNAEDISHKSIDNCSLYDVFTPDKSPTNASSISLIIETTSTRMLFLGDAWSGDMETALSELTVGDGPIQFDAIKISHHGSLRNTSARLLELVDAPVYFISSNGAKHHHPDYPVLKEIVDRPAKFERHLHFNYSTPASRRLKSYSSKSGARFSVHENSTHWIEIQGKVE